MSEDRIRDVLRALAETDASAEARPEVEVRMQNKFRSRNQRRAWRQAAVWVLAAAAIIVIFALTNRKPPAAVPAQEVERQAVAVQPEAAPAAPRKTAQRAQRPAPRPQEVVTDFFPLLDPAPPFERGQLLRVELPASAMQMVGLPVREDRLADSVQADVLVGEEGLPRAIRFVGFELK